MAVTQQQLTELYLAYFGRPADIGGIQFYTANPANTMQSVKAFAKDGSRYTFSITRLSPNKALDANQFAFDSKQYKGIRVEDLRM